MPTAPGYAHIVIEIKHSLVLRSAAITFGVNPTETDPDVIADAAFTAFTAAGSVSSKIDSQCTIGPSSAYVGTDGTADLVGVGTATAVGGRVGSSTHPGSAVLITKRTSRGGRRGKGRMYLPWAVPQSDVDEAGIILAADVSAMNTAVSLFRGNLTAASMPMVLLHKPSPPGTEHPSAMGAPDIVNALICSNLIASQRRRLGRG